VTYYYLERVKGCVLDGTINTLNAFIDTLWRDIANHSGPHLFTCWLPYVTKWHHITKLPLTQLNLPVTKPYNKSSTTMDAAMTLKTELTSTSLALANSSLLAFSPEPEAFISLILASKLAILCGGYQRAKSNGIIIIMAWAKQAQSPRLLSPHLRQGRHLHILLVKQAYQLLYQPLLLFPTLLDKIWLHEHPHYHSGVLNDPTGAPGIELW